MLLVLVLLAAAALAYANGANDNWKGVATLHGSGAMSFRAALILATVATVLGSATSIVLADGLLQGFSGKGLVPDELTTTPAFLAAVALAGAVTILLATRLGLPTSTTHALTGALLGISVFGFGNDAALRALWETFLRPLLLSPPLALAAAALLYWLMARARRRLGVEAESCACVEPNPVANATAIGSAAAVLRTAPIAQVTFGGPGACPAPAAGRGFRLTARQALDGLHTASAASVCFARAVNDTPKIAALALATGSTTSWPFLLVAAAMACGGLCSGRRVAETMSKRILPMNPGQGATSNLVTAALVLGASRLGLPVSTTHVSCASIMGIGVVTKQADLAVVRNILLAWLATLPLGAVFGVVFFTWLA